MPYQDKVHGDFLPTFEVAVLQTLDEGIYTGIHVLQESLDHPPAGSRTFTEPRGRSASRHLFSGSISGTSSLPSKPTAYIALPQSSTMLPKFLTLALFLVSFPCVLFSSALPFGKFFGTRASIALPRAVADTGEPGPVWSRSIDERGDVTEIEDKSTSSNNEFCDATEEGCKKKETTTGEGNSQGTSAPPTCPPNSQHCLKDAYGLYTISPTSQPTLCLRPDYGNPKILTAGTLLKYETCQDGYPNQLWNIRFGGDGTTRIQFAGSKSTMAYCLDAGSSEFRHLLDQWRRNKTHLMIPFY